MMRHFVYIFFAMVVMLKVGVSYAVTLDECKSHAEKYNSNYPAKISEDITLLNVFCDGTYPDIKYTIKYQLDNDVYVDVNDFSKKVINNMCSNTDIITKLNDVDVELFFIDKNGKYYGCSNFVIIKNACGSQYKICKTADNVVLKNKASLKENYSTNNVPVTQKEQIGIEQEKDDDQLQQKNDHETCISFGAKKGSQEYVLCRTTLLSNRTNNQQEAELKAIEMKNQQLSLQKQIEELKSYLQKTDFEQRDKEEALRRESQAAEAQRRSELDQEREKERKRQIWRCRQEMASRRYSNNYELLKNWNKCDSDPEAHTRSIKCYNNGYEVVCEPR